MDQGGFSLTVSLDLTYHDTFIPYSFGFKNTFNDSIKLKVYQTRYSSYSTAVRLQNVSLF